MMKNYAYSLFFFLIILMTSNLSHAQVGVGIPSSSVHPSAQLEVSSTTKGFLPPRLTQSQRVAISNPSTGLMVYQTDASFGYWYFDGSSWVKLMVPSINNTIPSGTTTGQILQWNGTQWVTTSVCEALSFLKTDVNNCGTCGNVCSFPNAIAGCSSGQCVIASCNTGFANCNTTTSDGCEINLMSSITNCGTCGNVCNLANASTVCTSGLCVISSCNVGFADCNATTADGCEINLNTSSSNCGACGSVCPTLSNATVGCSSGLCVIASCNTGFANCNNIKSDGCEVNLMISTGNCGACGNVCNLSNATSTNCTSGVCTVVSCASGFANCNGTSADGCEINILSSSNNCGACNNACPFITNGFSVCSTGSCVISCNSGFANCNGSISDGCEVNLSSNLSNCGQCGRACSLANATSTCTSSICTIATCNTGFANCNNNPVDGCEINLLTNSNNCGSCGLVCATGRTCVNGVCN